MNTKTLSPRALSVIDQYLHFKAGLAVCSVPYFNNKTIRQRAALRVYGGKGSPKDISEEVEAFSVKNHVAMDSLEADSLKKLLVDDSLGIDCAALAYYVLNSESEEAGKGSIDKNISFINCHGIIGKIRCSLRPIENCDVATFANDKNSRIVSVKDAQPGDMITMIGGAGTQENGYASERNHILIIHQVEYQNFVAQKLHYSHAVAYPEDGVYGTGIRQGIIEIISPDGPIVGAKWIEDDKEGPANRIFTRAQRSTTELRRLRWF